MKTIQVSDGTDGRSATQFQITSSLAQYDIRREISGSGPVPDPVVDWEHFGIVAKAIERFGNYMEHATSMSDADRARIDAIRVDKKRNVELTQHRATYTPSVTSANSSVIGTASGTNTNMPASRQGLEELSHTPRGSPQARPRMIPPPHNGKGNAPPPQQQHQQPQWQLYTEQEYQTPYHPQQSYQQQHFHPQDHQFCPIRLPHHHRQQQAPPKQRLKQPKPVLNPERRAQAAVVDAVCQRTRPQYRPRTQGNTPARKAAGSVGTMQLRPNPNPRPTSKHNSNMPQRQTAILPVKDFDGVDDGNGDEREEGVWEGKGEGYGDEDGGDLDDGDNVEGFHDLGNGVEEYGGEHDGDDVDVDDECDDGLGGEPEEVEDSDD